jgi:hypothetical protein
MSRAKPAKIAKLKDQIDSGFGLRGLCALGVLGAIKSCVFDSYGCEQICASRANFYG